jgi:hypothetical protein
MQMLSVSQGTASQTSATAIPVSRTLFETLVREGAGTTGVDYILCYQ